MNIWFVSSTGKGTFEVARSSLQRFTTKELRGGRLTRRYFTYRATILAALVLSSCGVSVIAGNYNPPQEVKYDSVWNAGWLQISKDSKPLIATSDAPGVCNVGGSQQGCVATDSKLIADFRSFASKLSSSLVPPEFSLANRTFHRYVTESIRGPSERDAAIDSSNSNRSLKNSNHELKSAQKLIEKALSQYRGPNKPSNPFS